MPQADAVTRVIKVRVDDVAGHFERARAVGAKALRDLAPDEYGCQTVAPWPV